MEAHKISEGSKNSTDNSTIGHSVYIVKILVVFSQCPVSLGEIDLESSSIIICLAEETPGKTLLRLCCDFFAHYFH